MTDDGVRKSLAARIKEARLMAGLSQGQVARLLGVHRPSISEIEAGNRRVSADELARMAELFDVDLAWLHGLQSPAELLDHSVLLAARELSKLDPDDMERLLRILATMRRKVREK